MSPNADSKTAVDKPEHLQNVTFLQDVAENALRESNLKVNNVKFSLGSSTGDNFCSQIYRIRMQVQGGRRKGNNGTKEPVELSVIVKCMPPTQATEFVLDLDMFLKEKVTYSEILPRVEMFLENDERFGPRLYHSLKDPVNTLVFEDLNSSNFTMASRECGFDLVHSKMVVRRMAQFHAASMILAERYPKLFDGYTDGLLAPAGLEDDKGMLMSFFGENARGLHTTVKKWPGYEAIATKLQKYIENFRAELIKSQAPRPDELKVLNHGDMWVNNIMFKYDDCSTPIDVIFIDYQLSVWGSPGIDLNYFFYTSLTLDVLKHKRDELIMDYYNTLSAQLKKSHYKNIPTYQRIRQEVRDRESYGFFANYAIYPLISMDKDLSVDASVDNFADEEFARKKVERMFQSKQLQETLRYTLKKFEEMGIWN